MMIALSKPGTRASLAWRMKILGWHLQIVSSPCCVPIWQALPGGFVPVVQVGVLNPNGGVADRLELHSLRRCTVCMG